MSEPMEELIARLDEEHQPRYGHKGDECSMCLQRIPCDTQKVLAALKAGQEYVDAILAAPAERDVTGDWLRSRQHDAFDALVRVYREGD